MRPPHARGMRSILLVLSVALVLAGCASPDNGATTTTTPPTGTTPTTPVTNGTALEVKKTTFDFSTLGTPAGGPASVAVEIPEGYTTLNLTVVFSPTTPVGLASGISVKVAGLTCALPDGPVMGTFNCPKTGPATAGPAKIEATGNGPVVASVTLMAE